MSVDHGGFDVFVSEEFLDGADVIIVLQKMGGKRVSEGVGGDVFVYLGTTGGFPDGFLDYCFVKMMAAGDASSFVFGEFGGGKKVLPDPVPVCIWVFAFKGVWKISRSKTVGEIFLVENVYVLEV